MLVNKISNPNIIDMQHFDEITVISEIIPPASFVGKSIKDLDLRNKYNISVVAIKNPPSEKTKVMKIFANPSPSTIIKNQDLLVVIGNKEDVEKMQRLI